jgi:3-hydroxy-9,10-secoandrosta-1,3,5(10)-triene-9,17-dione monooxygenase reductase component
MTTTYNIPLVLDDHEPSDGRAFRTALGHFCSGIVIVTAMQDGEPVGMTCQSFSSASLDPPLVMFLPARTSTTYPRLRAAGRVCINLLADAQHGTSSQFAASGSDKWSGVAWEPGDNGAPRLDGALSWIEATLTDEHPAGDHVIALAAVTRLTTVQPAAPLLYYRGGYGRFAAIES